VVRHFLAAYKFEIKNGSLRDIDAALNALQSTIYTNESLCIKIKEKELENNLLFGYAEYGKYGERRNVINVETAQVTKDIKENESPLDPYFYLFYFSGKNAGYLILERIGNIGIRTMFVNSINNYIRPYAKLDVVPMVIGLREIIENPVKEIEIIAPILPKEIDSYLERFGFENQEEIFYKIVISAKRNRQIYSRLMELIKEQILNRRLPDIGFILHEKERINIRVKVGKSIRTLNLAYGKFRTWIEIPPEENKKSKALEIIEDIKEEMRE